MNLNTINILALVVGKANKGALNGKSECQESWDQDSFYRTGRGGEVLHTWLWLESRRKVVPHQKMSWVISIKNGHWLSRRNRTDYKNHTNFVGVIAATQPLVWSIKWWACQIETIITLLIHPQHGELLCTLNATPLKLSSVM
jgi:hypothetical protein